MGFAVRSAPQKIPASGGGILRGVAHRKEKNKGQAKRLRRPCFCFSCVLAPYHPVNQNIGFAGVTPSARIFWGASPPQRAQKSATRAVFVPLLRRRGGLAHRLLAAKGRKLRRCGARDKRLRAQGLLLRFPLAAKPRKKWCLWARGYCFGFVASDVANRKRIATVVLAPCLAMCPPFPFPQGGSACSDDVRRVASKSCKN